MRNYEYKSINLGLNLSEKEAAKPAGIKKLETAIDQAINSMDAQGWDFHSQLVMPVTINPGCLGGLAGGGATTKNITVLVFRRAVGEVV
jgi:hypothetical protein